MKLFIYTLAAIVAIFSSAVRGADAADEKMKSPASPEPQVTAATLANPVAQEIASNPAKFLRATVQADNMGYIYAVVTNLTNLPLANVYVVVVHFDATSRQPDNQSNPLLVAASIAPGQSAQLKLEGVQVYKQADLNLYRVIVTKGEVAK